MPVSKQKTSTNQNAWAKLKQHMKTEPRYVPALAYGHIKISTPRRSFFKRWVLGKKEKEYTNVMTIHAPMPNEVVERPGGRR